MRFNAGLGSGTKKILTAKITEDAKAAEKSFATNGQESSRRGLGGTPRGEMIRRFRRLAKGNHALRTQRRQDGTADSRLVIRIARPHSPRVLLASGAECLLADQQLDVAVVKQAIVPPLVRGPPHYGVRPSLVRSGTATPQGVPRTLVLDNQKRPRRLADLGRFETQRTERIGPGKTPFRWRSDAAAAKKP